MRPSCGAALFHHVHSSQNLDARRHRHTHRRRYLIDLMKNTVDPKPYYRRITTRLDMDIRGALIESVLPQPIHQRHDVMIVGVQRAARLAQLNELFEIVYLGQAAIRFLGTFDRTRQVIELADIAADVQRARQHHFDVVLQHVAQLALPCAQVRLARSDHDIPASRFHR